MKQMLDIVENVLFKKHMPLVTYMRLDGSTDANKRHAVVQTFNSDPSIDCLLLTTHVGGLGLTLTGADTVIFVEHDWNPMKDLQAMDRAHRIGQKKVVNVYRLITKGTLEEKIMGYAKPCPVRRAKLILLQSAALQTQYRKLCRYPTKFGSGIDGHRLSFRPFQAYDRRGRGVQHKEGH